MSTSLLLCWKHHCVSFYTSTIRQANSFQQLHGSPSVGKRAKIIKLYSTRRTPRYATDHRAPVRILYDIVSCTVCPHKSCNFVSLSTTYANSNRTTHSEYPKKNLRSHSLHRLRHCVHRLVEMIGLDPLMQTLELSQLEVCFLGLSSAGAYLKMSGFHHIEFWPFLGHPPSSRCPGFTPPEILANLGPIPTFSAVRSTFLAEEEAHNLEFLPHPKFWPFLGRPAQCPFSPATFSPKTRLMPV